MGRGRRKRNDDIGIELLFIIIAIIIFVATYGIALIIVGIIYLIKFCIDKYNENKRTKALEILEKQKMIQLDNLKEEKRKSLEILTTQNYNVQNTHLFTNNTQFILDDIHCFSSCSFLSVKKLLEEIKKIRYDNIIIFELDVIPIIYSIYKDISAYDKLYYKFDNNYVSQKFSLLFDNYLTEIKEKIKNASLLNDSGKSISYEKYISLINENFLFIYTEKLISLFYGVDYSEKTDKFLMEILSIDFKYNNYYVYDLIYLVKAYVNCLCIAELFFIENHINKNYSNLEFYKILKNMIREVNDLDLVFEKIEPIYQEFYKKDLCNDDNDDLILKIIIDILHCKKNDEKTKILFKKKCNNFEEFDKCMSEYIENNNEFFNVFFSTIKTLKTNVLNDDLKLYFTVIENLDKYKKSHDKYIKHYKLSKEKERYILGNFDNEKELIKANYDFENITSGSQFELYLVNIFSKLNYKVKHIGKAGDQGADLILKYNDMTYVVQAKFYNSKLDNTPIQEVVAAIKFYNANKGIVITNSSFSKGAKELAKANDIILIDGLNLKKLVDYTFLENNNKDLFKDYEKKS